MIRFSEINIAGPRISTASNYHNFILTDHSALDCLHLMTIYSLQYIPMACNPIRLPIESLPSPSRIMQHAENRWQTVIKNNCLLVVDLQVCHLYNIFSIVDILSVFVTFLFAHCNQTEPNQTSWNLYEKKKCRVKEQVIIFSTLVWLWHGCFYGNWQYCYFSFRQSDG